MREQCIEEITDEQRLAFRQLMEVDTLTKELAEALSRKDQVSIHMLLAMRQEPINQLLEIKRRIHARLLNYSEEDAIAIQALLDGKEPPKAGEEFLCQMAGQNQRLLAKIRVQDEQISVRLGGNRSFYRKYRRKPDKEKKA